MGREREREKCYVKYIPVKTPDCSVRIDWKECKCSELCWLIAKHYVQCLTLQQGKTFSMVLNRYASNLMSMTLRNIG